MESNEKERILRNARQGDQKAFHQLYQDTFAQVQAECGRVLNHNIQDTEDAVQETYIKIFKHLDSVQDAEAFPGWCRRIAHNTAVDLVKTRRRKTGQDDFRPPVSDDNWTGMDAVDQEDPEALPEEQAEQEMIRDLLQQCMNDLGPQRAACFALYRPGMPYKEIAEQLALPVGTVKSNVHYAKLAVRKEIERIEKQEHIRIHGFALVLLPDGTVQVRPKGGSGTGFISAKLKDSGTQEKLWNQISRSLSPRRTAPFWKKAVSVALSVLVIAGGIFFGVNRAQKKTNFSTPKQSETQLKQVTVDENAPDAAEAETYFGNLAVQNLKKEIQSQWRNPSLLKSVQPTRFYWSGNTLIVLLRVSIDYSHITQPISKKHDSYYTSEIFSNVYQQNGVFHCSKTLRPSGKLLELYEDEGSKHMASGFATEKEAREAAGI